MEDAARKRRERLQALRQNPQAAGSTINKQVDEEKSILQKRPAEDDNVEQEDQSEQTHADKKAETIERIAAELNQQVTEQLQELSNAEVVRILIYSFYIFI